MGNEKDDGGVWGLGGSDLNLFDGLFCCSVKRDSFSVSLLFVWHAYASGTKDIIMGIGTSK